MLNTVRQAGCPSHPLVDLRGVSKTYTTGAGPVEVLRDVDLRIEGPSLVAVAGPSGSGKSTLLNLLAGIDRPTAGEVILAGTPIHTLSEAQITAWRGASVGVVFQFFQLLPALTAVENVMLPMDFLGRRPRGERRSRALELLERMGVADQADRLPQTLSGGQQQRVAIARALANDPPLVLADEPTGNLDSTTSRSVLELFAALVPEGRTVVLVTHEPDIAALAGRTVTIEDGEIHDA